MASSRKVRVLTWGAATLAALGVLGGAAFAVGSARQDGPGTALVYGSVVGATAGGGNLSGPQALEAGLSPGVPARQVGTGGGTAVGASSAADAAAPDSGERIMHAGSLAIETTRGAFQRTWDRAVAVAAKFGGRVMSSNRGRQPQPDSNREVPTGEMIIRVPASSFDRAMAALRALGTVEADSTAAEDVTEEYVDLRSRLRNLRAEQTALISLFEDARSVRDTLAVQQRLSEVEAEIERVTGRIKFIDERVAYSRITLQLGEPGAMLFVFEERGPSFGRAWDTAWEGLLRIGTGVMIGSIWLAPFAALFALVVALRRRISRARGEPAPATEPTV